MGNADDDSIYEVWWIDVILLDTFGLFVEVSLERTTYIGFVLTSMSYLINL